MQVVKTLAFSFHFHFWNQLTDLFLHHVICITHYEDSFTQNGKSSNHQKLCIRLALISEHGTNNDSTKHEHYAK